MGDKAENIGLFTPTETIIQKQKETFFQTFPGQQRHKQSFC